MTEFMSWATFAALFEDTAVHLTSYPYKHNEPVRSDGDGQATRFPGSGAAPSPHVARQDVALRMSGHRRPKSSPLSALARCQGTRAPYLDLAPRFLLWRECRPVEILVRWRPHQGLSQQFRRSRQGIAERVPAL
jgi:hypothetical protein